jgi:hypothetical protein
MIKSVFGGFQHTRQDAVIAFSDIFNNAADSDIEDTDLTLIKRVIIM